MVELGSNLYKVQETSTKISILNLQINRNPSICSIPIHEKIIILGRNADMRFELMNLNMDIWPTQSVEDPRDLDHLIFFCKSILVSQ